MKALLLLLFLVSLLVCCTESKEPATQSVSNNFAQYSDFVKDTFHIKVQLPDEYFKNPDKHYPTLFLLDGNFYFPMMASTMQQYELGGLLEPVILVGIGYSSFKMMDSLRVRDYLYPKALPSDEMKAMGGGEQFRNFLTKELIPRIDSNFRTQKNNRSLLGHSFGGYFVLYSLLDQLEHQSTDFKTFISASPTLWYNNFYLNKLPAAIKAKVSNDSVRIFLTAGALEDSVWTLKPVRQLASDLKKQKGNEVIFKSRVYSHLDHMDVGVLSFVKGLQEMAQEKGSKEGF